MLDRKLTKNVAPTAIRLRVDLIRNESSRGYDQLVGYFNVLQVPSVGESVNLDGDPFRIVERGWTLLPEKQGQADGPTQHCHARVLRAG